MSKNIIDDKTDATDPLEELDVIEARELRVGHEFHAFRFSQLRLTRDQLDDHTRRVLDETLKHLTDHNVHIDEDKLLELAHQHAVEANPISNFAAGVAAATKLIGKQRTGPKG